MSDGADEHNEAREKLLQRVGLHFCVEEESFSKFVGFMHLQNQLKYPHDSYEKYDHWHSAAEKTYWYVDHCNSVAGLLTAQLGAQLVMSLQNINVYIGKSDVCLVGQDLEDQKYRILWIRRPIVGCELVLEQVDGQFTDKQKCEFTKNNNLRCVLANGVAIYGFVRLMESYYILIITKSQIVAELDGHHVHSITEMSTIPLTYKLRNTMEETRYKTLLQGIDFTNGFFFCFTLDLSNTTQTIKLASSKSQDIKIEIKFVWNYSCIKSFLANSHASIWFVPIIFGFCKQHTMRMADESIVKFTLFARRSRMFAGTRNLRRGVDQFGNCANEVETEQIISRQASAFSPTRTSSLVQLRGSIPLWWSHVNVMLPTPDIQLERMDPLYTPTQLHWSQLTQRYGPQITVLSLLRQSDSQREVLLGCAFKQLCTYLLSRWTEEAEEAGVDTEHTNPTNLDYLAYDMLDDKKKAGGEQLVFSTLAQYAHDACGKLGYFVEAPVSNSSTNMPCYDCDSGGDDVEQFSGREQGRGRGSTVGLVQRGVYRVNCIDCLDRTNVAQFCFAKYLLPQQFAALGIELAGDSLSRISLLVMQSWSEHGDVIAQQYGGSGAMHRMDDKGTVNDAGHREFVMGGGTQNAMVAAQRYYANIGSDFERQQSMDLLLGVFEPRKGQPHIWEISQSPDTMRAKLASVDTDSNIAYQFHALMTRGRRSRAVWPPSHIITSLHSLQNLDCNITTIDKLLSVSPVPRGRLASASDLSRDSAPASHVSYDLFVPHPLVAKDSQIFYLHSICSCEDLPGLPDDSLVPRDSVLRNDKCTGYLRSSDFEQDAVYEPLTSCRCAVVACKHMTRRMQMQGQCKSQSQSQSQGHCVQSTALESFPPYGSLVGPRTKIYMTTATASSGFSSGAVCTADNDSEDPLNHAAYSSTNAVDLVSNTIDMPIKFLGKTVESLPSAVDMAISQPLKWLFSTKTTK